MTEIPEVDIIQHNIHDYPIPYLCRSEVALIMRTNNGTKIVLRDGNKAVLADQIELIKEEFLRGNLSDVENTTTTVLLKFAVWYEVSEIPYFFFKNGFFMRDISMLASVPLNKETVDHMFDERYDILTIIDVACHLGRTDIIYYLEECGRFNISFVPLHELLQKNLNPDIFLFFLQKYSESGHNFDLSIYIKHNLHNRSTMKILEKHLQLFIDEYNLNIHDNDDYIWQRACADNNEPIIKVLLPYYMDKIPEFNDIYFNSYLLSKGKLRTVNLILSLGADVRQMEEALMTMLTDSPGAPENNLVINTNKILRERMFSFYKDKHVTPDNGEELFNECLQIMKAPLNVETVLFSNILDYKILFLSLYIRYGVGFYMTTISNKIIQLLDPINDHVFEEYKEKYGVMENVSEGLYEKISDALYNHDLTQEMMNFLFIHCVLFNCCETAMLLRQNGADAHIHLDAKNFANLYSLTNKEIVDTIVETGTDISVIFKLSINNGYANTVRHLLLQYPYEFDIGILKDSRFIDKREISDMLIDFFTDKGYDINDIVLAEHFPIYDSLSEQTQGCLYKNYGFLLEKGFDIDVTKILNRTVGQSTFKILELSLPYILAKYGNAKVCQDMVWIMSKLSEIYEIHIGGEINGLYDLLLGFFRLDVCDGATMKKILYHYRNNENWKIPYAPMLYILTMTKYRIDALLESYSGLMD